MKLLTTLSANLHPPHRACMWWYVPPGHPVHVHIPRSVPDQGTPPWGGTWRKKILIPRPFPIGLASRNSIELCPRGPWSSGSLLLLKCAWPAQLLAVLDRDCSRSSGFSCTQEGLSAASERVQPLVIAVEVLPRRPRTSEAAFWSKLVS